MNIEVNALTVATVAPLNARTKFMHEIIEK